MAKKKAVASPRREASLTRDGILAAAIGLLDESGEDGLTFRALSDRLSTGPGAIYWHIANKRDLLLAACDAMVARTMAEHVAGATPEADLRALSLAVFDMMDEHPWVGSELLRTELQSPMLRIVERIGQQVRALGVPKKRLWAVVSALFSYIVGVGAKNAANGQVARTQGLDRDEFLGEMAEAWAGLDAEAYPFVRSLAGQLRVHDDRKDFLTGVDLILRGLQRGG